MDTGRLVWRLARAGSRALAVVAAAAVITGCGAGHGLTPDPDSSGPVVTTTTQLPRPAHVVVVIFENKDRGQLFDAAPYLRSLAAHGANFTNAHGIAHPSQPNYIALFSGSPQGVGDDACPQDLGDRPNLARQLIGAGHTFAGYSEGLPAAGSTACSAADGRYQRKHSPWADFSNVPTSSNLPYTAFPKDLSRLPTVSFVVPNMCHDMHSCPISTGDSWARQQLPRYLRWAQTHNSLLIVTFDEDDKTKANHIATFLDGPMVRTARLPQLIDHYSVLRTVEQMYGLAPLGLAARAQPLRGWVKSSALPR